MNGDLLKIYISLKFKIIQNISSELSLEKCLYIEVNSKLLLSAFVLSAWYRLSRFFSAHPLAPVSGSCGAGNRRAGKPAFSVRAPLDVLLFSSTKNPELTSFTFSFLETFSCSV